MKRLFTVSTKPGQVPGTMVYTGPRRDEPLRITLIDYDDEHLSEKGVVQLDECVLCKESSTVSWINIDGLNDTPVIEKIGDLFEIHPLVLEDVLHTTQRPKLEDHDSYLFLVVRMLYIRPKAMRSSRSRSASF